MKISNLPVMPTPTGAETIPIVSGGATKRTTLGTLMASVGQPYVDAAKASADQASGFALVLAATTAGGWFASLDLGAAAVAEGEGFFVNDGVNFYTGERVNGVGVKMASFVTEKNYVIDVRDAPWNAKGDAWQFVDGVIAPGALGVITFANTGWKASAVAVGNPICIQGAGAGGAALVTTIAGFIAPGTIKLATPAATAVAGASGEFGTNDRPAIQAAIDFAQKVGARVNYGGVLWRYLLAGAPAIYGSFTEPDGSQSPFPRGFLQLHSNVSHHGEGATLLVLGGYKNPAGIFYNDFWTDATVPLANVRITGLQLDCNLAHQVMTVYAANPGNGNGTGVWQHGNAISIVWGFFIEVDHCRIRNVRGDAARISNNGAGNITMMVRIHDNDFDNIFCEGLGLGGRDIWVERNRFRGDGYWVAGMDIEALVSTDHIQNVWVRDNTFDFSTGLSPVESTPQYASNSVDAQNARRHLRRVVSFAMYADSYPGGVYNGNMGRVSFVGNKVYQGTLDIAQFGNAVVETNQFQNFYEDVTGHVSVTTNCINFTSDPVTGLGSIKITGNQIDSDLDGAGVFVYNAEQAQVDGNFITKTRGAGVFMNASSGAVMNNDIWNVGRVVAGAALPYQHQAGVTLMGRGTAPIEVAHNRLYENRAGAAAMMACGVYSNCDGADIRDNIALGMSLAPVVENVPGHARLVGNRDGADVNATWVSSAPVQAPSFTTSGAVVAGGAMTAGGDMTSGGNMKAAGTLTGSKLEIQADDAGDVETVTWLSPNGSGGLKVHYQWIINTADNTMTLNQHDPATGLASSSVLIVQADGTLVLANTSLRIKPGALPVYADNASAVAGGLAAATMYRTATGQLMAVY